MNYQKIYNQLVQKRQLHRLSKEDCYCEEHHIIPLSEGGSDTKDNKVNLTAREHYIAHLLLAKIYDDFKMYSAIMLMSRLKNKINIRSRTYEILKKNFSKKHSERMKGKIPWNKGKTGVYSLSVKDKISESTKKAMQDPKIRKHLSDLKIGKPIPKLKGRHLSEETRRKISKSTIKYTVCQFSKEFKFIKEYESSKEAERQTGIGNAEIRKCCKVKKYYNTAGGYIWVYKDDICYFF